MKTSRPSTETTYAVGYAAGRHAARELTPAEANPFPSGSAAFHGWNDGHYDERSARRNEIERHNAFSGGVSTV